MREGGERLGGGPGDGRRIVYCLIPQDLGPRLHELLHRHFHNREDVEVVVEQRGYERRSGDERRVSQGGEAPGGGERRQVRSETGRRIAERRSTLLPTKASPMLPRRARRFAARITFFERLEPPSSEAEDLDTARLVTRFQAGEQAAFVALYTRYFDRVYGYLRHALADAHEAEDVTQHVFTQLFESMHAYERRRQPFRAWLFIVVRNAAVDHLRRHRALSVEDVDEVNRRRERLEPGEAELEALNWISDRDLLIFLGRLPAAQRQVLMLRFMVGLGTGDIARVLDRSDDDVRMLQHRALRFLRARLNAIGRGPRSAEGHRSRSRRRRPQLTVVRSRRFALLK